MGKDELIGNAALYGGGLAACTAPAAYTTESAMLLIFSACGAVATLAGLAYTVWNGNRNYKLSLDDYELKRQEMINENNQRLAALGIKPHQDPQPDPAGAA
jgi:hypothetical protein